MFNLFKKQTQEQRIISLLKKNWLSNYQLQQKLNSSSADRIMRKVRSEGVDGYKFSQRRKKNSKVYCLEYKLERV